MLPALVAQAFAEPPAAEDLMTQLVEKLGSEETMDDFVGKLLNKLSDRALTTSPDQSADNTMDHAKLDDTTLAKETVKSLRIQLLEEEHAKKVAEARAANATQKMDSSKAKAAQAQSAQKAAQAKAAQDTQKMHSAESQARRQVRSADSKVAHAEAEKKAAEGRAQSAETEAAQARAAKRAAQAKASQEAQATAAKDSRKEQSTKASSASQASQKELAATAGECCLTEQELVEPSRGSAFLYYGCAVVMALLWILGYALAKRRNMPKSPDAEVYVTLV